MLRAAGVELGSNYPRPIVEISAAREHLQQALTKMWEREAALKAARANGLEEGLGETFEVEGTGGPAHEKMDVHRVIVRSKALSSASSRRDQMVPSMPTESQKKAAAAILSRRSSPGDAGDQCTHAIVPSPAEQTSHPARTGTILCGQGQMPVFVVVDGDLVSTAESSSAAGQHGSSGGATVPIWSPPVSARPRV